VNAKVGVFWSIMQIEILLFPAVFIDNLQAIRLAQGHE
jgi:hypothetical protein